MRGRVRFIWLNRPALTKLNFCYKTCTQTQRSKCWFRRNPYSGKQNGCLAPQESHWKYWAKFKNLILDWGCPSAEMKRCPLGNERSTNPICHCQRSEEYWQAGQYLSVCGTSNSHCCFQDDVLSPLIWALDQWTVKGGPYIFQQKENAQEANTVFLTQFLSHCIVQQYDDTLSLENPKLLHP